MASFGASVSATVNVQNAAFEVLNRACVARGYTPDNDLGAGEGLIAAILGSMLKDEVRVAAMTVGDGDQFSKFTVYTASLTPASTVAALQFAATFTITGPVTTQRIFVNASSTSNNVACVGAYVQVTNEVVLQFIQMAASSTPSAGTYTIVAFDTA